jgi:FKBP-type peptidyl-prolyl cis-trans isomerase 2
MKEGDIIQLEYEGWIVGSDELFDTSKEELAREEEIFEEDRTYGPMYTVVATGRLIKGLDEHLLEAEVDKEYDLEIAPEDAYGERDPKNVETHSMRELARLKIEPEIGRTVNIRNKMGWISGIFAGRVRIDYNHKLAGKTLRYKYKVVGKPEEPAEIIKAIIAMNYGREDEFGIELEGEDSVVITLPDVCKYDPNWTLAKLRLVNDMREIANMTTVTMREVYVKKEAAEETPAEETEEEAPAEEGVEEESEVPEETEAETEAPEEAAAESEVPEEETEVPKEDIEVPKEDIEEEEKE